jgi:hypothetical protein
MSMTTIATCNVCVEKFNKTDHIKTKCPYCDFEACKECNQTYFLSTHENAHCMNCKREFNYDFLVKNFTRKFTDVTYKKHFEQMLYEKELSLLPATQLVIEQQRKRDQLKQEMNNVKKEIAKLTKYLDVLKFEYNNPTKSSVALIRKCPDHNCKGYLSNEWKCGICEKWCCKDCNEILGLEINLEHVCKPEEIESAKLLQKETKPCPNCAIPIFKLEGCDQMYCIKCNTPFSWRTGAIQKGAIHNPHYIEMINNNGKNQRNLMEIRCGRDLNDVIKTCELIFPEHISFVARKIVFIRHHEMQKIINNQSNNNLDLRIKFLKSEISENQFKLSLQKRYKRKIVNQEIAEILYMYTNTFTEIIYRHLNMYYKKYGNTIQQTTPIYFSLKNELDELRIYTNKCLSNLSKLYKSREIHINDKGTLCIVQGMFITKIGL